ncbi:MAG: ABC transporter substrate-binding protein [Sarcina sp.]
MKKKTIMLFVLFMSLMIFSGCKKIDAEVISTKVEKEEIFIGTTAIPESLESINTLDKREEDIICMLFDGLVERTAKGDIVPVIAKGWKISTDNLEYKFIIDENYKWSNGEKIKANDFLEYFSYLFSPNNKKYISNEMFSIYGIEEYKKGNISFDEVGIHTPSENELIIKLSREDQNFLENLSKPIYRLRDADDNLKYYKDNFNLIKYTGAYKIKDVTQTELTLVRNEVYKGEFIGASNLKFIVSGNSIDDFAKYNVGKLDLITNPPITVFSEGELINDIESAPTDNLTYLIFNCRGNIAQYLDFRKAIYWNLKNSIYNNYMIKNKLATADVREFIVEEVVENIDYINTIRQIQEFEIIENEKLIKELIDTVPSINKEKIKIIGIDNFENKKIIEFLEIELKKMGLNIEIALTNQEILEENLKNGYFDILIDSSNFMIENIKNINEEYIKKEFSILSLYKKNDFWCKNNLIKMLYLDANGNLIYKKSIFDI